MVAVFDVGQYVGIIDFVLQVFSAVDIIYSPTFVI